MATTGPTGLMIPLMQASALPSRPQIGRVRWGICALLFFATSINYADRQVLGILAPLLQRTIGWNELQYSYIVSAFQVAYAVGLILVGRMVDRLGTRAGYAIIIGMWSLAAMAHSLAYSAFTFGVARFFLGAGESGNFPAAIKTTAEWFPQRERSLATGIFNSGANLGAILAPAFVPWITLRYGWRSAFVVTGALGFIWIVFWLMRYQTPARHTSIQSAEFEYIHSDSAEVPASQLSWVKLLSTRQTWAYSCAKFLTDPIWWFYLYWMPKFFDSRYHVSFSHLGLPLIIVYNVSALGSVGGGYLPAWLNRRHGMRMSSARLTAMLFSALLVTPIFFASSFASQWSAVAVLSIAAAAHQGWSANLYTTASDMFPRSAVGTITGIGGMAGSVGGVLFALSTGWVLQVTHSYALLFGVAASAYLVALLVLRALAPDLRKASLVAVKRIS